MGNCTSTDASGGTGGTENEAQVKHSREIDKVLREDERKMAREVKMLLLGSGESGKTTVLQMKIIHLHGFSSAEREHYRQQIFQNVCGAMRMVLDAMDLFNLALDEAVASRHTQFIEETIRKPRYLNTNEPFPQDFYEPLVALWQDPSLQRCLRRGNEFGLPENMFYFYPELLRLFSPDYQNPTDQDILRCRGKTTGITETIFSENGLVYRMYDVGGQRSERRKWVHCFEAVTAILFLVAISSYDQCLLEDRDSNAMQEALMLFDSICNSQWFTRTSMILFLNKVDLFREKLGHASIKRYFADYDGDETDYNTARDYFKNRFVTLNRSRKKEVYTHYTTAVDTNNLRVVMLSVSDIIINRNLQQMML